MAKFGFLDKVKFENLFGMSSGYVIDFSDRSFQEFVLDAVNIDIYDKKYDYGSGSKANRLRGYWSIESNYNIGKLLENLLEYWIYRVEETIDNQSIIDYSLYQDCLKIAQNLQKENPIKSFDALIPNSDERDFLCLAEEIKKSIEKNEPEKALDRLHTFTVKYIRQLCENYGVKYDKKIPLHSLFGGYIKEIDRKGVIESEMTTRILKSSISVLQAFNDVRNNKSFAHDNPILNYNESVLIYNSISNLIEFLKTIEKIKTQERV